MWEIIRTSPAFTLYGQSLPRMPFVLNAKGLPFEHLNAYLLYRALDRALNVEKTVMVNARHLCAFFNELKLTGITLENLNEPAIILARNSLQKRRGIKNAAINGYLANFYQFLWWLETTGRRRRLIGIPNVRTNTGPFQVAVEPARTKGKQYHVPLMLKSMKTRARRNDSIADWDCALDTALGAKDQIIGMRDFLMMRLIRDVFLRRFEVVGLRVGLFDHVASTKSPYMHVRLEVDKNSKERTVKVPVDLYRDIQTYVKTVRNELLRDEEDDFLFISKKTGRGLTQGAVNDILKKFGVHPHEGRGIGLTERFCELIIQGIDQPSAILIVSQEAGHSQSSNGKTFLDHYLLAQSMVAGDSKYSLPSIRNENSRLRRENKRLLERMRELETIPMVGPN